MPPPSAGVLVLEELEHARARGAPILAEFVGGAVTCDAHHMTEPEPDGRGVIMCIQRALERSGVAPEQVSEPVGHRPVCRPCLGGEGRWFGGLGPVSSALASQQPSSALAFTGPQSAIDFAGGPPSAN